MTTIQMDGPTKRFYQGVGAANKVTEAHKDLVGDYDSKRNMWWLYVGLLAGAEHGITDPVELAQFMQGVVTRAPEDKEPLPPVPDDHVRLEITTRCAAHLTERWVFDVERAAYDEMVTVVGEDDVEFTDVDRLGDKARLVVCEDVEVDSEQDRVTEAVDILSD